jgi:hypothetical protein
MTWAEDRKPPASPRPVRVLLLASAPTREFLFVRSLFADKREAQGFDLAYHLQNQRRPEAIGGEPPAPLTRFPDHLTDLAADKAEAKPFNLASYDVLIAFDPDWTALKSKQLETIAEWVEAGGGLVIVAGPIHTPHLATGSKPLPEALKRIAELYPVVLGDLHGPKYEPTQPWRLHLIQDKPPAFLQLDPKGTTPLAGWEEFFTGGRQGQAKQDAELVRGFYNFYPVQSIKKGAVVLATFADPKVKLPSGEEQPFLVRMSAGKGQVVFLGSGELWRLRQYRTAFHTRFWIQLARFAKGP